MSKRARKGGKFAGMKFQMMVLNPQSVAAFQAYAETAEVDMNEVIVSVCEGGWKISASYSENYSEWFVSITAKTADDTLNGQTWGLSHVDLDRAIMLVYWLVTTDEGQSNFVVGGKTFMSDI